MIRQLQAEIAVAERQLEHAQERRAELLARRVRPEAMPMKNRFVNRVDGDIMDIQRQLAILEAQLAGLEGGWI